MSLFWMIFSPMMVVKLFWLLFIPILIGATVTVWRAYRDERRKRRADQITKIVYWTARGECKNFTP